MDLRPYITDRDSVESAKRLAVEGLLTYQPFIFSDDFECGVGYEFSEGRYAGLVYYPALDPSLLASPQLKRLIAPPAELDQFRAANQSLRQLYDAFIDEICRRVGDVSNTSFLDVGCNSGYFPLSFSLRGAREAAGCDRQDFSRVYSLLNKVLKTNATFIKTHYDPRSHTLPGCAQYDVVTSLAVLCHVSDPLFHLAALGSVARKALFVWTIVNNDAGYTVHYGEPRNDYPEDRFPVCFDNKVCPSLSLIRRSLELMGFQEIIPLPAQPGLRKFDWQGNPFRGLLALR